MEKIEIILNPKIGTKYLVLTVRVKNNDGRFGRKYEIPVLNHLHNDVENGQTEKHYHIDNRFDFKHHKEASIRISEDKIEEVFYKPHALARYEVKLKTPVGLIANSKLKHNCIYKGKCPHRGYDLSNTKPIGGIITCPLHPLKFDAITKELING